MSGLLIDGFDTSAGGVVLLNDIQGWRGAVPLRWPIANVPGIDGVLISSIRPKSNQRRVGIAVVVEGSTQAVMRTNLDNLKARLKIGRNTEIAVGFSDDSTREFLARCENFIGTPVPPALVQPAVRGNIQLFVPSGKIQATSDTVRAFGAATAIVLGNAPVRPVIRITGASTNPSIVYRNFAGAGLQQMDFTITIAGGDFIDIDSEKQTIVDQVGGNKVATFTAGDFIELDPVDGDFPAANWPTLELVGSGTAQATYRKQWW